VKDDAKLPFNTSLIFTHLITQYVWLGHVKRMEAGAMPGRMMEGRLFTGRREGRRRLRWMDDVVADLSAMRIQRWTEKAGDRQQWRMVVEEAKVHPGL
jgi:hypothetical protein